ncbi:MAG: hypothetical protein AAF490_24350, partial [Chloroflexota bacterium]
HDMIGNAMEWSISQTDGKGVVWGRLWDLHIEGDYLIDLTHNLIEPDANYDIGFRIVSSEV